MSTGAAGVSVCWVSPSVLGYHLPAAAGNKSEDHSDGQDEG
ncbi:MAG: hypothetical protein ACLR4W_01505 [Oscillospiraceae bacterium]